MPDALAASLIDIVLGLQLGSADQEAANRVSLEGLTVGSTAGHALECRIRSLAATSLRLASGPLVLEVGRLALNDIVAQVRLDEGRPRLSSLAAASAELSGVKVHGPLAFPAAAPPNEPAPAGDWSLGPLASVDGTIRAEIVDAHLLFDADVTVPIRQGKIDFKDATVEHVGPDSRMGVSRMGLYVDAPNGRSYLYQFSSTPVGGVEYERRGALLGPFVTDRGNLRLQPFAEGLLRQGQAGPGVGFTEQARLLFDRTAVSGEVRLGDGRFAAPGVQADLVGRAEGRNAIRLHSQAVGRGLTAEMALLSVRNALLNAGGMQLGCDEITGGLTLRLTVEGVQVQFGFELATMKISGLHLDRAAAGSPP